MIDWHVRRGICDGSGGWHRADGGHQMTNTEHTRDPALGRRLMPFCLGHPRGRRGRVCSRLVTP
jgi:hypothetical protein